MTEHDPQPGELWWTGAGTLVWHEDGWHWTVGERCKDQNWTPVRLVGYTAEYVEKLRAANTGDGEALAQLVRDVRDAPDPGHTVEIDGVLIGKKSRWLGDPDRKPWEVLREAESITNKYAALTLTARCEMLTLARELEAKAAEDSRREQRIEKAALAVGHIDGWTRGVQPETVARALDEAGLLKDADDE